MEFLQLHIRQNSDGTEIIIERKNNYDKIGVGTYVCVQRRMMMELFKLNAVQQNILIASIIADGGITKLYKGSRRKNNSYSEHFGIKQCTYREWKASFFPDILYIRPNSQTLCSKSMPLFTELYSYFYDESGCKKIPVSLLQQCSLIHFPTILYMDDGTLSITSGINHRKKAIYLMPYIYLYLQSFPRDQLSELQEHLFTAFQLNFRLSKRKDGHGYILRFTSTIDTYNFLKLIAPVTAECEFMHYKTNWGKRFMMKKEKYNLKYPGYEIIASHSDQFKNYSEQEIKELIHLKKQDAQTDTSVKN